MLFTCTTQLRSARPCLPSCLQVVAQQPTVVGIQPTMDMLLYAGGLFNPSLATCPPPTDPWVLYVPVVGYSALGGLGRCATPKLLGAHAA